MPPRERDEHTFNLVPSEWKDILQPPNAGDTDNFERLRALTRTAWARKSLPKKLFEARAWHEMIDILFAARRDDFTEVFFALRAEDVKKRDEVIGFAWYQVCRVTLDAANDVVSENLDQRLAAKDADLLAHLLFVLPLLLRSSRALTQYPDFAEKVPRLRVDIMKTYYVVRAALHVIYAERFDELMAPHHPGVPPDRMRMNLLYTLDQESHELLKWCRAQSEAASPTLATAVKASVELLPPFVEHARRRLLPDALSRWYRANGMDDIADALVAFVSGDKSESTAALVGRAFKEEGLGPVRLPRFLRHYEETLRGKRLLHPRSSERAT